MPPRNSTVEDQYWKARQCIKFSPVINAQDEDLKQAAIRFLRTKLDVGVEDVDDDCILEVRRVRGTRGAAPSNEVLVILRDVETRDLVSSFARNLATQDASAAQRANIRMEIPMFLMDTFRVLDRHGHLLKEKYGSELRRHVRYDDENMSCLLYTSPSPRDLSTSRMPSSA